MVRSPILSSTMDAWKVQGQGFSSDLPTRQCKTIQGHLIHHLGDCQGMAGHKGAGGSRDSRKKDFAPRTGAGTVAPAWASSLPDQDRFISAASSPPLHPYDEEEMHEGTLLLSGDDDFMENGFHGSGAADTSLGASLLERIRGLFTSRSGYEEIPTNDGDLGDSGDDEGRAVRDSSSKNLLTSLRSLWSSSEAGRPDFQEISPHSDGEADDGDDDGRGSLGRKWDPYWEEEEAWREEDAYSFGDLLELSWETRILCFVACFLLGSICSFISSTYVPLIAFQPAHFALFFSAGNVLSLCSSGFLIGPKVQFKAMFHPVRRGSTAVYLGSIVVTLYAALSLRSTFLTLLGIFIQTLAYLYYSLSYIPYGRAAFHKLGVWIFDCLTCQRKPFSFCPL